MCGRCILGRESKSPALSCRLYFGELRGTRGTWLLPSCLRLSFCEDSGRRRPAVLPPSFIDWARLCRCGIGGWVCSALSAGTQQRTAKEWEKVSNIGLFAERREGKCRDALLDACRCEVQREEIFESLKSDENGLSNIQLFVVLGKTPTCFQIPSEVTFDLQRRNSCGTQSHKTYARSEANKYPHSEPPIWFVYELITLLDAILAKNINFSIASVRGGPGGIIFKPMNDTAVSNFHQILMKTVQRACMHGAF